MASIRRILTGPALILFTMAAAVTALEGPDDDDLGTSGSGSGETDETGDTTAGSGYAPVLESYLPMVDQSHGVLVTFTNGAGNGTDPFSLTPFVPTQLQSYSFRYSATGPGTGSVSDWFAAATPFQMVPPPGQPFTLETDYWFQFAPGDCGEGAKTFHIAAQGSDDEGMLTGISNVLRVETAPDGGAPSPIAGLAAVQAPEGIQVTFVAPSDDASGSAKVGSYRIKIGLAGSTWDSATTYTNDFLPNSPGLPETLSLATGLGGSVEVFIAGVDELLQEGDPRSTLVFLAEGFGGGGSGGGSSSSSGCSGSAGPGLLTGVLLLLAAAAFRRA